MIPYSIHVALVLSGCLLFYKALLQRETFYRLNRFVLLLCLLLSFCLPLVPKPAQWDFGKAVHVPIVTHTDLPQAQPATMEAPLSLTRAPGEAHPVSAKVTPAVSGFQVLLQWCMFLYWFGVIAFGLNFLLQVIILMYQAYSKPFIKDGRYRIVEVSSDKAPCSFGNTIFINPEKYDWETYNQILLHEKVHIRQGHTFDLIFAELALVFQWFNPFAWLYRQAMETNLEYLADDALLQQKAVEKTGYQLSLLKVSTYQVPLRLTTNYNQSLLKKRIVMMNTKKSNVHTAWKYGFLFPMLLLFICLLNKPAALSQTTADPVRKTAQNSSKNSSNVDDLNEGSWFATIKRDTVSMQFKSEDDRSAFNNSTFLLDEFSPLPKNGQGEFTLKREAGTMHFTGKFEGDQGMGHYKFAPDKTYQTYLEQQGVTGVGTRDLLPFFFINVRKNLVEVLKKNGYSHLDKGNLTTFSALKIDEPFIRSWKEAGYKNASLQELVTLKALRIEPSYLTEIRNAGLNNISITQLIQLKSQNVDAAYIRQMSQARTKKGTEDTAKTVSPDELVMTKALQVDSQYIQSFQALGYNDLTSQQLFMFKSLKIQPGYIKSFQAIGYTDIPPMELVALKTQGVTPELIKSFQAVGYKNISFSELFMLRSLGITSDLIKRYNAAGFDNISIHELGAAKTTGVTPDYISSMKQKGFDFTSLDKYIQLKQLSNN
ncbi:MAG: M56 family metallopeptidase [Williamsia sp.]|nr:M56 family metallopeptidase [Williamsia sp.]